MQGACLSTPQLATVARDPCPEAGCASGASSGRLHRPPGTGYGNRAAGRPESRNRCREPGRQEPVAGARSWVQATGSNVARDPCPETGSQEPARETERRPPRIPLPVPGTRSPGTGRRRPKLGPGDKEPGTESRAPAAPNPATGARNPVAGNRSPAPEAGSRRPGTGCGIRAPAASNPATGAPEP